MKFLNYNADASYESIKEAYQFYREYLIAHQDSFPHNAFEFAIGDWHYNPSDHRCPHDAWLEKLAVIERGVDPNRKNRLIDIQLTLLGAHHNGNLQIQYEEVRDYSLAFKSNEHRSKPSHGDWLIDEISLSQDERVLHEIHFSNDGLWIIECKDIGVVWEPF